MVWFIPLLIAIAVNVAAYFLMPRPKKAKPPEVKQAETPTAEAGKPVPVLFGTMLLTEANILHEADKGYRKYKVKV